MGRIGGSQEVMLDGSGQCPPAHAQHELGHALGLHHTQSRSDRDNYISITWANIDPEFASNYYKYSVSCEGDCGQDVGPYDYASMMHYAQRDFILTSLQQGLVCFSPNASPLTEFQNKYGFTTIGQRVGMSVLDLQLFQSVYGTCMDNPPPGELDAVLPLLLLSLPLCLCPRLCISVAHCSRLLCSLHHDPGVTLGLQYQRCAHATGHEERAIVLALALHRSIPVLRL